MAIITFMVFSVVFCHLMNKWASELEEPEADHELALLAGGRFATRAEETNLKQAA